MACIIINADDFGLSDGVCRSILELYDAGAITSTTIMCAALGAQERFRRFHVSSLLGLAGVHLQLTSGIPLSPAADIPTIVDHTSGKFRDPRAGQLPDVNEVELEWRRQIEAARAALGALPTHLDSHHGVHRIPQYFSIYAQLAAEFGLSLRGANGSIGEQMRSEGIQGTVVLVREWTGRCLGPEVLRTMVDSAIQAHPGEEVAEIICHPGYNDSYLSSISGLSAAREDDHKALMQLARDGWPKSDGHKLVSHAYLAPYWSTLDWIGN